MGEFKQPMLARDYDPDKLEFPVWASPKIDGYRCQVFGARAMTRSGKEFRNRFVQSVIGKVELDGLDGELIVGQPSDSDIYNKSSGVMAFDGVPEFTFVVFDDFQRPELNFETRFSIAATKVARSGIKNVVMIKQTFIQTMEELDVYESEQTALGYEGIMLRRPGTEYKHGRSTVKEGFLQKVKRFAIEEGEIIGGEELMHNENEAFTDALGKTKRSEAKDGLVPSGMLGAYIVKNPKYEKPFKISAGSMSHDERRAAWSRLESDKGKMARYKFLPHGTKDVPRHGLFAGLRDQDDL